MTLTDFEYLKGIMISKIMAVYFKAPDGIIGDPYSIVVPGKNSGWTILSADGQGLIRADDDILDGIFFDGIIGFSFIAPLIMMFEGQLDGSETITSLNLLKEENKTTILLSLANCSLLSFRFEDDEIYFDLTSLK